MDTTAGRHAFVEFFAHYPVPAVPRLADTLTDIRCPTTIIWGDRDAYIPLCTASELAARIP